MKTSSSPRFSYYISALSLFFCLTSLKAGTGIFETYAVLNANSSGNTFYDCQASTGNTDYHGANLGTYNSLVNSLLLQGGEVKTFKNSGGDVTGAYMYYRIWSGSESGSFTEINLPFDSNLGGGGDQKWQKQDAGVNILTGLGVGTYTLEVFFKATSNEGDRFSSNGGANYEATFTVIPEPANIALGIFCGLFLTAGIYRTVRKNQLVTQAA